MGSGLVNDTLLTLLHLKSSSLTHGRQASSFELGCEVATSFADVNAEMSLVGNETPPKPRSAALILTTASTCLIGYATRCYPASGIVPESLTVPLFHSIASSRTTVGSCVWK
jgi:hypothetical protein